MSDMPDCESVWAKLISVYPEWPNNVSHPDPPLLVGRSAHQWQVQTGKCAGERSFSCWLERHTPIFEILHMMEICGVAYKHDLA